MDIRDRVKNTLEKEHGFSDGPEQTDTPAGLHANLRVERRDKEDGVLIEARDIKNIITNNGADYVRTTVGSAPLTSAFRFTAIGDTANAFASADNTLNNEVARSSNAFNTTSNFGQFSNVTTFTDVAATVRESGIFNRGGTDAGTALAMQTFGDITLTTQDRLEVIWKVFFSEV